MKTVKWTCNQCGCFLDDIVSHDAEYDGVALRIPSHLRSGLVFSVFFDGDRSSDFLLCPKCMMHDISQKGQHED